MRRFLIAVVLVAAPARAGAQDNTQIELAGLAKDVATVLAAAQQTEVRMGHFIGDGKIPSSFGPEIQRVLIAELDKLKIKVNPNAAIEVKGSYAPSTDDPGLPGGRFMFIRVNAELVNAKNRLPLANARIASRGVYGNEDLGRAFAPSVSLAPNDSDEKRNQSFKLAIEEPKVTTAGALVKAPAKELAQETPFAVEILVVGNANAPDPVTGRTAVVTDGRAFVPVKDTEFYRVRVHNGAEFDAAVRLSIDGLDQFAFADPAYRKDKKPDEQPIYQYMIVPAKKSIVISGWFRNLKQADAFVITGYSKSAAAELNVPEAKTGQICAQFYAAWDKAKPETKPKDEPEDGRNAATGRGEPIDVDLRPVNYRIGVQRAQVSIRYAKPAK